MATLSSILAWRIPWAEEPGYNPWGCKESNMTEQLTHAHTHTHTHFLQHRILLSCHLPCSFPSGLVSILSFNIQNTARKPSSKVWFELLQFSLVAQLCPTLCDPVDCSPPGFSVYGILQARILEWVAIPFSRGSSQLRDQTWVSRIGGRFFTV